MLDFEDNKMEVPNIDHLRFRGYSKYPTMNKVIKALNIMQGKTDHNEEFKRNGQTYEMLKDIEILHPPVTNAFKEEVDMIMNALIEIDKARLHNMEEGVRKIRVGYWWYLLFDKAEEIYLPSGSCKVELDKWSVESVTYFEGEGYSSTINRDNIFICK